MLSWRALAILGVAIVGGGSCGTGNGSAVHTGSGGTTTDGAVVGGSHGSGGMGGSSAGGSGGSEGAPLSSAAGFGPAFEHAMCEMLVPCGAYPDVATCEADTVFADGALLQTMVTDVQRGIVRYDASAAAACIAALPTGCEITQKLTGEGTPTRGRTAPSTSSRCYRPAPAFSLGWRAPVNPVRSGSIARRPRRYAAVSSPVPRMTLVARRPVRSRPTAGSTITSLTPRASRAGMTVSACFPLSAIPPAGSASSPRPKGRAAIRGLHIPAAAWTITATPRTVRRPVPASGD